MRRNGQHVEQHVPGQYHTQGAQNYVFQHDFDGTASLTTTLVHAIADVTGTDVSETEFTLHDHVDPDALDRLFAPEPDGTRRTSGHVSFAVWGYRVTVHGDGHIAIVPPRRAPPARAPPR